MLVLTMKESDEILVGDTIVVRLVSMDGSTCRVGITAPPAVIVDRRKVRERGIKEGFRAAPADDYASSARPNLPTWQPNPSYGLPRPDPRTDSQSGPRSGSRPSVRRPFGHGLDVSETPDDNRGNR